MTAIWKTRRFKIAAALALVWAVGAVGWLLWWGMFLVHNAAAVICGYPNTTAPGYPACYSAKLAAEHPIYAAVYREHWLWIVLPAAAILLVGFWLAQRGRPVKL